MTPGPMPPAPDPALAADYAHCLRVARHAENFPVASRLLPARFRPHLAAVYAFARGADDLADEPAPRLGTRAVAADRASRLAALDEWERALDGPPPPGAEAVFRALSATRAACALPLEPLRDLVTAFRWDVERDGFPTWAELGRYADRSAAPVGRLVLAMAGRDDPQVAAGSDELCVALQLTNFWQDLSVDWPRGRLYLPEEAWAQGGLDRARLEAARGEGPLEPARLDPPARAALGRGLGEALSRTEQMYARTEGLPARAGRPLDLYLATVWEGGHAVLARVRALGERAFAVRARLGAAGRAAALGRALARARLRR